MVRKYFLQSFYIETIRVSDTLKKSLTNLGND